MFSMLDAIMDRPMDEVLANLALPDDVRALVASEGSLRDVLDAVVAFERGDWAGCARSAADLGIDEEELASRYHDASRQATQVFAVG